MKSKGVYFRIEEDLLEEFARTAESMGLSRSEALRLAIKEFIRRRSKEYMTDQMLGILKSCGLTLRELDDAYHALKYGDEAP